MLFVSAACSQYILYPTPAVATVSPTSVVAGGPTFQLTIAGTNFVYGATVLWNTATSLTPVLVNNQKLQVTIDQSLISTPGTISVLVVNPPPGGGDSNSVNFTINPSPSNVPTITSLQPTATQAAGSGFTLTVNGTRFTTTSVVTWDGQNLATAFVNSSEIQASVPASNIQTAGIANVAVLNSVPGGGLSNTVQFLVNDPQPTITSISPTQADANAPAFALAVNGTNFVCQVLVTNSTTGAQTCTQSNSVVNWNGSPVSTTWESSGQLVASISQANLGAAGVAFVTVTNPSPGGGTSSQALFQVIPGPNGQGLPELVDFSSAGAQANAGIGNLGQSGPAIGGGGRFVAFSSVSQNLIANLANAVANVFEVDTCLGISQGCTPQTILASVGNNAEPPNADCLQPSISSNGRFVVYTSAATNLVTGATSGANEVYLTDTCLGTTSSCAPSTTLVSVAPDGVTPGNGASSEPSISPDGQYVAFISTATNLLGGAATGAPEVYVRSTCASAAPGCTPSATLVSVAADGLTFADGTSSGPVVSSGGRYVAFSSTATNLVSIPSAGSQQLYWRDTCIGASSCAPATSLVSIGSDGTSPGNDASSQAALTSDGRYVVFSSKATNLLPSGLAVGTPQQVYERDMCAGASGCTRATTLVSVATDGVSPAANTAEFPQVDQSGRFAVFASTAPNLASTTNGFEQIFGRDTCIGATNCTPRTALLSTAAGGQPPGNGNSLYPAITTQAHFVTFLSFANNLVGNDTEPTFEDIFLAITTF
jgi:hypothetical protein